MPDLAQLERESHPPLAQLLAEAGVVIRVCRNGHEIRSPWEMRSDGGCLACQRIAANRRNAQPVDNLGIVHV